MQGCNEITLCAAGECSAANWEACQEGVMGALAVPPPEEQMRKVAEIESGRAE